MYLRELLSVKDCIEIHKIMRGVNFQDIENLIDSKVCDIEDAVKLFPELLELKPLRSLYGRGRNSGRSH